MLKDYRLEDRIGSGGFGAVYRARQTTINREVAIKVILPAYSNNPDFIRRFQSEAQLIARLEHPHITPLIDFWRDTDGAYLVMRYLRGGSLRHALDKGSYELLAISHLLDQITAALDFAHRSDVIHRDIKPGNILLDEDGNAYLADFGIAKDLKTKNTSQTAKDTVVGSLDYISPEQARSELVTPRTDIYSLGVTLFEMVTGEHPFKEASSVERLYKHINDPLPEILDLSTEHCDAINDIIQKATAKDPNKRYQDVMALAIAFHEAIGRESSTQDEQIIEQLTMRQHEILAMIADGLTNSQIADELFIAVSTVRWHINQLYKVLGVRNRVQAIIRARELNLIVTGNSTQDLQPSSDISSSVSLPEPDNPYKGLYAFQSSDTRDFFGRHAAVEKLIERMTSEDGHPRFVTVVGPSGSGKSSLVRAGLIPAIWRGAIDGSEKWFVVDMIPGSHPIEKLETALIRVAANQAQNLFQQLERDDRGLLRVADIILPNDKTELLLVIDQFEEVFTLVEDEATRTHFLALLRVAATDPRSRVRIVATLRADYYDRPLHYPEFGDLIRSQMETLLPLSAKGLERAIRGPAERVGVTFEQGLVEQIISDVNYQAGALPLLQYALTELFDRRQRRIITHQAYQDIGGAIGALTNRADEIYRGMTDQAQQLTHQMFLRLVTLGEGAEDTRRRVTKAELLSLTSNIDLMEEIIEQFANYRLLALDHDEQTRQPTVEVAHEAILQEWQQLKAWIDESRADLRSQRQFSGFVEDWKHADEARGYLLNDARLSQFEIWANSTQISLTPNEKRFLHASISARSNRQAEESARQARETQLEQRARRFLQVIAVGSSIAALLAVGLSIFAFSQQQDAQRERDLAQQQAEQNQSLVWAFQARTLSESNTPLALRLALESISIDNPPSVAQSIAWDIAQDDSLRYLIRAHVQIIQSIAVNNDGTIAITGSCAELVETVCMSGELAGWDLTTGTELWRVTSHQGWINAIVMTPNEDSVIAGGCGLQEAGLCTRGDLIEYDVMTGDLLQTVNVHDDSITALQYHSTEPELWLGTADGFMYIWSNDNEIIPIESSQHTERIVQIAFNLIGTQALSGDSAGHIIHWNAEENTAIQSIDVHSNTITGLILVDEQTALTASLDFTVKRWDLETGDTLEIFTTGDSTSGLLLSPNEESIYILRSLTIRQSPISNLSAEQDRFMREWYPSDLHPDNQSDFGTISTATLAQNTPVMPVGYGSGLLAVWELETLEPITAIQGSAYLEMAIHPDGTQMALGTLFGTLEIWDIDPDSSTYLSILHNIENDLAGTGLVDYNADGSQIVWGVSDYFNTQASALYVVDSETGDIVQTFDTSQHLNTVRAVRFMADNAQIVSGSQPLNVMGEADLIIWDIETGDVVEQFTRDAMLADITDIAVVDDTHLLLSGAGYERVRLFNIVTGEVEQTFDAAHSSFGVQYLSQSGQIFSGTSDGIAVLWDANTAATYSRVEVQNGWIFASDISPNEQYAIVASDSQLPALLDLETGTVIQTFPRHQTDNVWGVAFSPDGQSVWTADMAGAIYQWRIEDEALTGNDLVNWIIENRYIHDPTCDVREQYRIEPLCDD